MRTNPHRTKLQRQRKGHTYDANPPGTGGIARRIRRRPEPWKEFAARMRSLNRKAQGRKKVAS